MKKYLECVLKTIETGFYFVCLAISKGFFFYLSLIVKGLKMLFNTKFFKRFPRLSHSRFITEYDKSIKPLQYSPVPSYCLIFLLLICGIISSLKISGNDLTAGVNSLNSSNDNVYNIYRKYNANTINEDKLRKDNKDYVGWISIDSLNVNYPLVQSDNNNYYRNYDFLGNSSSNGWIYLDSKNKFNFTDKNTVIYADKDMIEIEKLLGDKWYSDSSRTIIIKNDTGKHVYEVFSAYFTSEVIDYVDSRFKDNEYFTNFISHVRTNSINDFSVSVDSNDFIITIVSSLGGAYRGVVHAKLLY